MKKLMLALGILLFSANVSFADCLTFQCPANPELSNGFARALSNATGTNFIAEKAAQSIIKSQIKKEAKGSFNVKVDSFSLPDLKAGRFKGIEITGKDIVADDVYLSYLKLKTLCDYNYIVFDEKNNTATFKEDFGMAFAASLTENDLNNTMKAAGYNALIDELNSVGGSFNLFKITTSHVKIRDNKFMYVVQVAFPFVSTKKDVVLTADINVHNGKIIFSHTKLINNYFAMDLSNAAYAINYLNPLNFTLKILENKDADMQVNEAVIKDNKINVDGTILVLKDVVTKN